MDRKRHHTEIGSLALDMLSRQSFIPGQLIEERSGETCVCTGAAMLYCAHRQTYGDRTIQEFFSSRAIVGDQSFVFGECQKYGLDANVVWDIIIVSKSLCEKDRPNAVAGVIHRRVSVM